MHSSHHMTCQDPSLHYLATETIQVSLFISTDSHYENLLLLAHSSPMKGGKVAQQSEFQPMEVRAVGQETPSGQAVIIANPPSQSRHP